MAKCAKLCTWILRIFQLNTSLILIGILGYMAHEFNRAGYGTPKEVAVPLIFSVFALFVSFWSLLAICCLGLHLQILATLLDFGILAGYIASAVLLHDNFHSESKRNPLRNWLIYVRAKMNESTRVVRTGALVKLLDAGIVCMIILFFFTSLLSWSIAYQSSERHASVYGSSRSRSSRDYGPRPRDEEMTQTESSYVESSYTSSEPEPRRGHHGGRHGSHHESSRHHRR